MSLCLSHYGSPGNAIWKSSVSAYVRRPPGQGTAQVWGIGVEVGVLFFAVILLVAAVGVVLAGVALAATYLMQQLLGRGSGLARLAAKYPAPEVPVGELYRRQWVAVGPVSYWNTGVVAFGKQGLYLWVRPMLSRYRPVLIPWGEIRGARQTILALQRAVRFTVGDRQVATVVFTEWLFEKMRPYLKKANI